MLVATQAGHEKFEHRAETLQQIFQTLPIGVMVADIEGRLLFVNPAAEQIMGKGSVECLPERTIVYGWYLSDQITLVPAERFPLCRASRGEEIGEELYFVRNIQRPDGIWISITGGPLSNGSARVSGGVIFFHDVTEHRRELQAITLLSRVVEQTADSVMLTDKQGTIQYVNPAFEATSGYQRNEVLGGTPRILKSGLHDAEFYSQLWGRLMEGQAFRGMIINRKKSGELYWAQQTITPIRSESGNLTHFVSVLQDITELRKEEEHEFQLRLARKVQQQFYGSAPTVAGFDLGGASYPAYETGGDYFDFIPMPNGHLGVALGDVEGHGFGSALVMALTRAYLRSFATISVELDHILSQVNRMLAQDLEHGRFATLALARLDIKRHTLTYAGAGHMPGFILRGSGEIDHVLESGGLPLGLFPDSEFSCLKEVALEPGQIVVLLTDGITESTAPGGSEFGVQGALDYIVAHREEPARQIADGLHMAARKFSAYEPQSDDITSVIIKVT
ncbi:MAG TPA: SpoIIE family protein phosphatase [Terriglobales bacterium]|jgi:PAS domain S-box-containing protein|nr:SpoIIE family protein phosphatase [Terriglobales bacterium]